MSSKKNTASDVKNSSDFVLEPSVYNKKKELQHNKKNVSESLEKTKDKLFHELLTDVFSDSGALKKTELKRTESILSGMDTKDFVAAKNILENRIRALDASSFIRLKNRLIATIDAMSDSGFDTFVSLLLSRGEKILFAVGRIFLGKRDLVKDQISQLTKSDILSELIGEKGFDEYLSKLKKVIPVMISDLK